MKDKQLLKNKDIKQILNNAESNDLDLIKYLLQYKDKTETYVQQAFKKECNDIARQYNHVNILFKQNDNGGYSKLSTKLRKNAEGTISGVSDCEVWIGLKDKKIKDVIFFEVKRLGTFTINDNQIDFIDKIKKDFHCDAYITNNLIFFRDKIIEKIQTMVPNTGF